VACSYFVLDDNHIANETASQDMKHRRSIQFGAETRAGQSVPPGEGGMPETARNPATGRLPWRRNGTGFVAYPDGDWHQDRYAALRAVTHPGGSGGWGYVVCWGGHQTSGFAATLQDASDAANRAWPEVIAAAAEPSALAVEEARMLAILDDAERGVSIDPGRLRLETADTRTLVTLIAACRNKWEAGFKARRAAETIEPIMNAVSAELFRRRVEEERANGSGGPT
jgi:hypothetical protein